ncbi:hypothetical protein [Evansella clarkii]|uniref:hypothetical protein n=1 Tax=Evansella clarkii TaxID=79879 RepID=UPI0014758FE2|nr:hypothetical protein [Evansella clarkii]
MTAIKKRHPGMDTEMGSCCQCEKSAVVRSYGGEPGDYCSDCHIDMLNRINDI